MLPGSPCHRTVKLADLCCTRTTSLSFCQAFGCLICLTWQMEVCDKTKAKGSPLSRHVSNEEKSHAPLTGSNQSPVPEHGNKKWDPFFRNRRRRAFNRFCLNQRQWLGSCGLNFEVQFGAELIFRLSQQASQPSDLDSFYVFLSLS